MPRLFFTYLFIFLIGYLVVFYWRRRQIELPKEGSGKHKFRPKLEKGLWVQVYDTDSADEARKIQNKFHDMNIQCFLYEQGKKDVFGSLLKHYGISVPRKSFEKAQSVLAQITL